jgi:hypothetical protein
MKSAIAIALTTFIAIAPSYAQTPPAQAPRTSEPPRTGMTWGVMTSVPTQPGVTFVSCHGQPKAGTQNGSCNAYFGDTACTTALPVLCIKADGRKRPANLYEPQINAALPSSFYAGWAAGEVNVSKPVRGDTFKSRGDADKFCESSFGNGWRMAGFHDGNADREPYRIQVRDPGKQTYREVVASGGWGFQANGKPPTDSRFWVAIRDQPANCWAKPE